MSRLYEMFLEDMDKMYDIKLKFVKNLESKLNILSNSDINKESLIEEIKPLINKVAIGQGGISKQETILSLAGKIISDTIINIEKEGNPTYVFYTNKKIEKFKDQETYILIKDYYFKNRKEDSLMEEISMEEIKRNIVSNGEYSNLVKELYSKGYTTNLENKVLECLVYNSNADNIYTFYTDLMPCSMQAISEETKIATKSLKGVIGSLVKKGLVRSENNHNGKDSLWDETEIYITTYVYGVYSDEDFVKIIKEYEGRDR